MVRIIIDRKKLIVTELRHIEDNREVFQNTNKRW